MELKEYIQLIKRYKINFVLVWLAVVAASFLWLLSRPTGYEASMAIEISRTGGQSTDEYQYDQYYRMEADNKFADTVAIWLKDPSVVHGVYNQLGQSLPASTLRGLSKTFQAEKLSANYIRVSYAVSQPEQAEKIAQAANQVLTEKVSQLNPDNQPNYWFKLLFGKPIVAQSRISWLVVLGASMATGFLLALMTVVSLHYWKE